MMMTPDPCGGPPGRGLTRVPKKVSDTFFHPKPMLRARRQQHRVGRHFFEAIGVIVIRGAWPAI